jgi:Chitobiase/beta-hexosaminidase C-terminal domain
MVLFLSFLTLAATSIQAQTGEDTHPGIAWQVRGNWQVEGKGAPIRTGDAVRPGSLLQPAEGTANDSITVLLPDGQPILYECFTAEDCARGFRVPWLYRKPEPLAVDMLARIRAVLVRGQVDLSTGRQRQPRLPRDEVMAVLGPDNRADVAGLAAKLSNGSYTYDLRPLDRAHPRQFQLALKKTAPSISIALPSAGIYFVTITDALNTQRIDLFIAAVKPAQAASLMKSFRDAQALIKQWNEDYQSWPVHDFQRAYLASIVLGVNAQPADRDADMAGKIAANAGLPGEPRDPAPGERALSDRAAVRTGVTAEPTFSPRPGLFDGKTAITLQCKTPGATIHFTVNGSQPVANSPVYREPIMVIGSELTIKSFASEAGRKDSAVVTGIFRIEQ